MEKLSTSETLRCTLAFNPNQKLHLHPLVYINPLQFNLFSSSSAATLDSRLLCKTLKCHLKWHYYHYQLLTFAPSHQPRRAYSEDRGIRFEELQSRPTCSPSLHIPLQ